jgi:hypothetical protein
MGQGYNRKDDSCSYMVTRAITVSRQDVFLHDLMKPALAHKEIGEKNYRALEEYLDLLIRTFDIAEEAGMLPVVLHMNNLQPMYEKWPHGEQAMLWTHPNASTSCSSRWSSATTSWSGTGWWPPWPATW